MAEEKIFELLLKTKNNNDNTSTSSHSKLHTDAVNIVARNISEIIYESFKQKSSATSLKRGNLLKYINDIAETRDPHLHLHIEAVLGIIKKYFDRNTNITINQEVPLQYRNEIPSSEDMAITFRRRRNLRYEEKFKHFEFVRNWDQEKLISKYQLNTQRRLLNYEVKETNIDQENKSNETKEFSDTWYREQQIKLSYALFNLQTGDSIIILKEILGRLTNYQSLNELEKEFLKYLWLNNSDMNLSEILLDNYFFIMEGVIIKYATNILKLDDELEIGIFFNNLKEKKEFQKLKTDCLKRLDIYLKLKQVIYELYCLSFCNENVLKLCNLIAVRNK